MSVIVNTNVQALIAQRSLSQATTRLQKSSERLATGLRINSAVDDAAGLYIAENLESKVRGLEQCRTNLALGINVLQIAEGDLTTIQSNIQRIKDLATEAASNIYATASRNAIALEIQERMAEIDRIATSSSFNGFTLLDGNSALANGMILQVGAGSDMAQNSIQITGVFTSSKTSDLFLTAGSVATATAAAAFIKLCEDALDVVVTKRTKIGVSQSRLEAAQEDLATSIERASEAKSTIADTDIATETTEYTKQQILQQLGVSILTQANQTASVALSLLQ